MGVHAGAREAGELAARERRGETKPSRIPRAQHWQPNERTYVRMETYENVEISILLTGRRERRRAKGNAECTTGKTLKSECTRDGRKPDGKSEFLDHVGTAQTTAGPNRTGRFYTDCTTVSPYPKYAERSFENTKCSRFEKREISGERSYAQRTRALRISE